MAESNDVKLMDKNKLLKIFEYLNERLEENQLQLDITVYGGSVMAMVYDLSLINISQPPRPY